MYLCIYTHVYLLYINIFIYVFQLIHQDYIKCFLSSNALMKYHLLFRNQLKFKQQRRSLYALGRILSKTILNYF